MTESYEEIEDIRIEQVYNLSRTLRELHEDVAFYEHALIRARTREPEEPFAPTFFLYIFFTFNTIYSIDWKESLQNGSLIEHRDGDEIERKNRMISLCFSDNYFVDAFFPQFMEIMTMRFTKEEIIKAMNDIIAEGVEVTEEIKNNAKSACKKILSMEGFSSQNGRHVKTFSTFIYLVRCNIVHGTKLTVKGDPDQNKRILIYSYFLVAIQHMLFMFLEYKANWIFLSKSDIFIDNLRSSH